MTETTTKTVPSLDGVIPDVSKKSLSTTVVGDKNKIFTHILVTGDEKILNEVDVPVLTHETCTDWYEAENILIDKEQHVCAGYEQGGLDACQGDSGGPFGKFAYAYIFACALNLEK